MEELQIHNFNFQKHDINSLSAAAFKNYPIVYILHNNRSKPKAYIGQSVQVRNRLNNHLADKEKSVMEKALIIEHKKFNQSATYNIETKLINYFIADQQYELINKSQITQSLTHNYYEKPMYDKEIFESIWNILLNRNIVKNNILEIENRDIFKLSPYKELTESQMDLKEKVLDFCEKYISDNKKSVFFIKGEAGTGKSVILSSILNTLQDLSKDDSSKLYKTENHLLVNHNEVLKVYEDISKSLTNLKKKNFLKPTTFVNQSENKKIKSDVTLVDEAHLLLSREDKFNNFNYDNHLEKIIEHSKITIIVFDDKQFLKLKSFWSEDMIKTITKKLNFEEYTLTDQFRMKANDDIYTWIDQFANHKEILNFPNYDENYEFKIFENAGEMHQAIKEKDKLHGLSRVVSTFDYTHKKDGADYFIEEPGFKLPWNRTYEKSTWAETPETINEVGSIYTVQGFDLNYVGVILGPSVSYDEENDEVYIITKNYKDSEAFRSSSRGTPHYQLSKAKEDIILNSINILMKRGIRGLYIYASDEKLRQALLKKQGGK